MLTEQTLRRRRGRAIRKARRTRRTSPRPTLADIIRGLQQPLVDAALALQETLRVIWLRMVCALEACGDSARRQLLDNGRGPSKGGR